MLSCDSLYRISDPSHVIVYTIFQIPLMW